MRYRRARVEGGASIFTVNLAERHQSLLVECIKVLRKVVGMVQVRLWREIMMQLGFLRHPNLLD